MEIKNDDHVINVSDKEPIDRPVSDGDTAPAARSTDDQTETKTKRLQLKHKLMAVLSALVSSAGLTMLIWGMATNDWSLMSLKQTGGLDVKVKVGLFQVCFLDTCKYWNDIPDSFIIRNRDAVRACEALTVMGAAVAIISVVPMAMGVFAMFCSRSKYAYMGILSANISKVAGAIIFISFLVWIQEVHSYVTDSFGFSIIITTASSFTIAAGGFMQYTYSC